MKKALCHISGDQIIINEEDNNRGFIIYWSHTMNCYLFDGTIGTEQLKSSNKYRLFDCQDTIKSMVFGLIDEFLNKKIIILINNRDPQLFILEHAISDIFDYRVRFYYFTSTNCVEENECFARGKKYQKSCQLLRNLIKNLIESH